MGYDSFHSGTTSNQIISCELKLYQIPPHTRCFYCSQLNSIFFLNTHRPSLLASLHSLHHLSFVLKACSTCPALLARTGDRLPAERGHLRKSTLFLFPVSNHHRLKRPPSMSMSPRHRRLDSPRLLLIRTTKTLAHPRPI